MTGGRIKRIAKYLNNETFFLTYGDGLSDVPINDLLAYHQKNESYVTLTAIQPGGRFGVLDIADDSNRITKFVEKAKEDGGWVNGGFMVVEPEIIKYIKDDQTILEREPFELLSEESRLSANKHSGFWQCMDTQRDKYLLDQMWAENQAPWRKW
jgi:glucose-1-phosphate cytidylyltransferase